MNRRALAWLERLWYPGAAGEAGRPPFALRLAASVYGLAVRVRASGAAPGTARPLPVPCVSVGNLSVGGTGKTPLVAWLIEELAGLGARPAVISRGYGGSARGPALVPATGDARTAATFGDEPALLAARHPGLPVVVGRDRRAAGLFAASRCGATILVADDAFQHRRLARDLDIVAIDASRGMGNGRLFPAGPLREPPASLGRAGAVVLTRVELAADAATIRRTVERLAPRAIHAEAELAFGGLYDVATGARRELAPGAGVYAFSGIGNPGSFRRTLESLGVRLAGWEVFPDHHPYGAGEARRLARAAAASGAVAAVTTAKDAIRVPAWEGACPLYRAEVKLAMIRGREQLWEALKSLAAGGRG